MDLGDGHHQDGAGWHWIPDCLLVVIREFYVAGGIKEGKMKGARELLGSTIIRQGKPYKVVGVTYNILGVWLQLERGRERLTIKAEEGHESERSDS